jgi:protein-tyrosine phosphatase
MSLWMVGQIRCEKCEYTERRAVDLVEIATGTPANCPNCGGKALDYEFNVFHWSWITGRLAVGGRIPDFQAMQRLREEGITHVLNVAAECDESLIARDACIVYCHAGCEDDYEPKPPEFLDQAVQFALDALAQPGTKLHVHCYAGARRSMMVTLAILRVLGMSQQEAMDLLSAKRAAAQFVPAYVESVENYLRYRALRYGTAASTAGSL